MRLFLQLCMYPVALLLPARGYRVLGGYTGPLHAGGYRSGGYTLLLPGFCTPHPYGTVYTVQAALELHGSPSHQRCAARMGPTIPSAWPLSRSGAHTTRALV